MSVRDVLMRMPLLVARNGGQGKRADAILSALHAAGFAVVPVEMSEAQARRSLDGHALADHMRDVNPDEFARLVKQRRATWRQMVEQMRENAGEG